MNESVIKLYQLLFCFVGIFGAGKYRSLRAGLAQGSVSRTSPDTPPLMKSSREGFEGCEAERKGRKFVKGATFCSASRDLVPVRLDLISGNGAYYLEAEP